MLCLDITSVVVTRSDVPWLESSRSVKISLKSSRRPWTVSGSTVKVCVRFTRHTHLLHECCRYDLMKLEFKFRHSVYPFLKSEPTVRNNLVFTKYYISLPTNCLYL